MKNPFKPKSTMAPIITPVDDLATLKKLLIIGGVYKHYKGNLYVLLGISTHADNNVLSVVYHPIDNSIRLYNRSPIQFCSTILSITNTIVPRFEYIGTIDTVDFKYSNILIPPKVLLGWNNIDTENKDVTNIKNNIEYFLSSINTPVENLLIQYTGGIELINQNINESYKTLHVTTKTPIPLGAIEYILKELDFGPEYSRIELKETVL